MGKYDKQLAFIKAVEKLIEEHKAVLDFAPGQFLLDMLTYNSVTQAQLSRQCSLNVRTISTLCASGRGFTPDTCLQLQGSRLLGVKAEVWAFINAVHTIRSKRDEMKAALQE